MLLPWSSFACFFLHFFCLFCHVFCFVLTHWSLKYDTCDRRLLSTRLLGISQNFATDATSLQNEVQKEIVSEKVKVTNCWKFFLIALVLKKVLNLIIELRLGQTDCCRQKSCEPGKPRQIILVHILNFLTTHGWKYIFALNIQHRRQFVWERMPTTCSPSLLSPFQLCSVIKYLLWWWWWWWW